jgi:hypothetical protein
MSLETLPLTTLGAAAAAAIEGLKPRREIIQHEPGVYLDMPDEEYHADDALGSTDIRHLVISGSDYWWRSKYNPFRDKEETKAQRNGHALHHRVLFGEAEFHRRYARKLVRDEHPDALVTADDLKRALSSIGGDTKGLKAELAARLLNMSTRFRVWDAMVAEQESAGRVLLDAADYDRILISTAMIEKNPSLAHCFQNGMPEVSVFWKIDGVRFKARFDYMRLNAIIDMKSFTNTMDKPVEQAIRNDFGWKRLDLQASHYLNARQRARAHIHEGRVFGDGDREWLLRLAEVETFTFVFVFYSVAGAAIARGWQYDPGTELDQIALIEIEHAVDVYKGYRDRFGLNQVWVDQTPVKTVEPSDIPHWVRSSL